VINIAKTGKATIRGRAGKSTSGKKVSVYSPQYSQTTGKEAEKRGTTSAEIALAKDLSAEQKATATALDWSAEQARAYDPSTQVALKSGEVISKVQQVGGRGVGEAGVTLYTSKSVMTAARAKRATEARQAAVAQEAAQAAYSPIIGKEGEIIDAIQKKGAWSSGEREVALVVSKSTYSPPTTFMFPNITGLTGRFELTIVYAGVSYSMQAPLSFIKF